MYLSVEPATTKAPSPETDTEFTVLPVVCFHTGVELALPKRYTLDAAETAGIIGRTWRISPPVV